ncbi:hypothetical protein ACHAAC_01985 [Aeromicrobium sp. CF4.19]|uniref:hypothetical protein n=1 Tax=Aeromicrobium sp. CF4.19 TaxID=3373082 RepID=UPI003EE4CAE8
MSRRRVVVAATGPVRGDEDATLPASRRLLLEGDEVVHLGTGLGIDAVARAAVAEDAVHVVLVEPTPEDLASLRAALDALDADDVSVAED